MANDHGCGLSQARLASRGLGGHAKDAVAGASNGGDRFAERDLESVRVGHATVVTQRFLARGLLVRTDERHAANLEQLRRREKHHVGRIVQQRVDERALLDDEIPQAARLGGNARREAGGTSPDDQHIEHAHDGPVTGAGTRGEHC